MSVPIERFAGNLLNCAIRSRNPAPATGRQSSSSTHWTPRAAYAALKLLKFLALALALNPLPPGNPSIEIDPTLKPHTERQHQIHVLKLPVILILQEVGPRIIPFGPCPDQERAAAAWDFQIGVQAGVHAG